MTQEQQPLFNRFADLLRTPLPEIRWPTDVTPDNLKTIDGLIAQKRSPGASVALFIDAEAKGMAESAVATVGLPDTQNIPQELFPIARLMTNALYERLANVFGIFAAPAKAVTIAEEMVRSNSSPPIDNGVQEWVNHSRELQREVKSIFGGEKVLKDHLEGQAEPVVEEVTIETDRDFIARKLGKILEDGGTLHEVVDWYTEFLLNSSYLEQEDRALLVEALRAGQQRFHTVYQRIHP